MIKNNCATAEQKSLPKITTLHTVSDRSASSSTFASLFRNGNEPNIIQFCKSSELPRVYEGNAMAGSGDFTDRNHLMETYQMLPCSLGEEAKVKWMIRSSIIIWIYWTIKAFLATEPTDGVLCSCGCYVVTVVVGVVLTLCDCKIKWALPLESFSWLHNLEGISHNHYFLFIHSECVWRNSLKIHGSHEERAEWPNLGLLALQLYHCDNFPFFNSVLFNSAFFL